MAEPETRAEDAALWRRWRALAPDAAGAKAAPDPLLLAAYAEGRLGEAEAEVAELWLAAAPEALADVAAARAAIDAAGEQAPDAVIARAQSLIAASGPNVVPLVSRRVTPQLGRWRVAMAWGGIAASVLATSLVGFALGNDTYVSLTSASAPATDAAFNDLLYPSSGLSIAFEDSRT
jgi:hypothetical protein